MVLIQIEISKEIKQFLEYKKAMLGYSDKRSVINHLLEQLAAEEFNKIRQMEMEREKKKCEGKK